MAYRLAVAFATLMFATAAVSGTVYRWQDDSGRTHYGQQPPKGVEAEPIRQNVSQPASSSGQQSGNADDSEQASAEESGDSGGTVDEDYVRKQCEKARRSVTNLKKHGPDARYANENDEIVTYSKEQYQQRLDKAQRFKKRFCDDKENSDGQS